MLNSISKVLEKIVSNRLISHFELNNIFSNNQYAYRKGRGTDLAITKFTDDVLNKFDAGQNTLAIYLDLTRAFDCVNHSILIQKLEHYGISGEAINWFKDYLSNRKYFVTYDGARSRARNVNIGVPQGSILGPFLFLIYINDLINSVQRGTQLLFADDANHYQSGEDVMYLIKNVNNELKSITAWLRCNKLSLNVIKTEAMIFARNNLHYPLPPIILDGTPIPYSYSVKFLGVIIDHKLNWKEHIRKVQNKLSNICGVLYTIRNKISSNIARQIYLSLALPYLTYCNIVWSSASPSHFQSLISTQKKIIRLISQKRRNTHTNPLFIDLKLLKFDEICKMNLILFVFKSINNFIPSPITFEFRIHGPYNIRNREPPNWRTDHEITLT